MLHLYIKSVYIHTHWHITFYVPLDGVSWGHYKTNSVIVTQIWCEFLFYIILFLYGLFPSFSHTLWQQSCDIICKVCCNKFPIIWFMIDMKWMLNPQIGLWDKHSTHCGLVIKTGSGNTPLPPPTRYVDGTPTSEVTPVTIRYIHPPHQGYP